MTADASQVTAIDLVTLAIALLSLLIGGGGLVLGILAERRHRRGSRRDVSLRLQSSSVTPGHPAASGNPYVMLTVTNNGTLPVGIEAMGLRLADGEWLQFAFYPPNERHRMGDVLATGEPFSMWATKASVVAQLDKRGTHVASMGVKYTDGTEHSEQVPAQWQRPR